MIYNFIIAEFLDAYNELTPTYVNRSLDFDDTNVKSLGNLRSVDGTVYIRRTEITSLGNLERVRGFLDISFSKITSLGNLKRINVSIDIRGTSIMSLGKLQHVAISIWCDAGEQYERLQAENNGRFKIKFEK